MLRLLPDDAKPPIPAPAPAGATPLFALQRREFLVLVVDDDAAKRYVMSRGLRAAGFRVVEAAGATEALALQAGCAAAVLDVYLPDMNGFDLCRRVRAARPTLPIVQVSSVMVEEPYRQAGHAAGANAYLTEPGVDELVRTLDGLLQSGGGAIQ